MVCGGARNADSVAEFGMGCGSYIAASTSGDLLTKHAGVCLRLYTVIGE